MIEGPRMLQGRLFPSEKYGNKRREVTCKHNSKNNSSHSTTKQHTWRREMAVADRRMRGTGGVDFAAAAFRTWEARRLHLSWWMMGTSTVRAAHTGLWSESNTSMHAL